MSSDARRHLILLGLACAPFSAAGLALYSVLFRHAPAQDFMVYHTAANAVLHGNVALLFDGQAFTATVNAHFATLLAAPLTLHPWVYPPLFLLVVVPFGLMPFGWAAGTFLVAGAACLAAAMRLFARSRVEWAAGLVALAASPPAIFTVAVGQNAFLTTALTVGGFGLLRRAPAWAGVLLGALVFKPQLWLLVPVALVAGRQWRVLGAALATSAALTLLSLAAFGVAPWRQWLRLMLGQDPQFQDWLMAGRLYGQSMFTEAVLLGASHATAQAVQAASTLAAAAMVWAAFRRAATPADISFAVLLVATLIAAPHVSNYDALMLIVAATLLLGRALREGFLPGETLLLVVVFAIEALDPPKAIPAGLVTPLVLLTTIAALFRRAGARGNV